MHGINLDLSLVQYNSRHDHVSTRTRTRLIPAHTKESTLKLSIAFYSFWTFVVMAIFQVMEVTSWSWGYVLLPAAVFIGALVREMEIDIAVDKYLRIVVLVGASALTVGVLASTVGCWN